MTPRKETYLLLSVAVLALDQWTKWLVETRLPEHVTHPVIPGLLNFTHVTNTGIAFGLFASGGDLLGTLLLTALGLTGLGLLFWYFVKTPPLHRLMLVSLALILGGAVGNLADRVAAGEVTDFVDFYFGTYHWYTFNVADSAITVGILLMALELVRPGARGDAEAAAGAPSSEADDGPGAAR